MADAVEQWFITLSLKTSAQWILEADRLAMPNYKELGRMID